jgi:hypothetical protein
MEYLFLRPRCGFVYRISQIVYHSAILDFRFLILDCAVFISSAAMSHLKSHAAKQSENLRRTEEINTVLLKQWRRPVRRATLAQGNARSTEGRNAAGKFCARLRKVPPRSALRFERGNFAAKWANAGDYLNL